MTLTVVTEGCQHAANVLTTTKGAATSANRLAGNNAAYELVGTKTVTIREPG